MNKLFKNPYLNSVYAEIYIIIVALIMRHVGKPDTPDNFFTPIAALSLFVLSATVMAWVLLGEPLRMYLDGEKKQSATFFIKTITTFAIITLLAIFVMQLK